MYADVNNRPFHSIPCICITLVSTIATNSIFLLVGVKTERRSNVREDGLFVGVQRTIRYLRRKGTLFVVGSVNASKGQKTNCSHGDSVGHASRDYRYRRRSLSIDRRNGRSILFYVKLLFSQFSLGEREIDRVKRLSYDTSTGKRSFPDFRIFSFVIVSTISN